jgi:zinc and cadmium transporter
MTPILHSFPSAFAAIAVVQVASMLGVGMLKGKEGILRSYLPQMVSVAAGVLLGTALLHLMPEALEQMGNRTLVWMLLVATFLGMFAVERIAAALTGTSPEPTAGDASDVLHHHHTPHSSRPLNLVFGGFLHSFVDGAGVAAAFAVNPRVGIVTACAITLHEIPHRLGDFALLLHLKLTPRRAFQLTALEGTSAFLGVLAVAAFGATSSHALQYLLPVSAASFLYIASVNLLPELQNEYRVGKVLVQLLWLVAGVAVVALIARIPGS